MKIMKYYPKSLKADGREYEILYEASRSIKGISGLTCEIGLREGGGSEAIAQGFLDIKEKHLHIAIDPYGSILCRVPNIESSPYLLEYPNEMKRRCLPFIYKWFSDRRIDFLFFCMEDTEFFNRFSDGIPVYEDKQKSIVNQYALVYFDGPKITEDVIREIEFFRDRTPQGGIWVFDDTGDYDHASIVHDRIISFGFSDVRSGHKWVYKKAV
jgi:hypothetical protein